MFEEPKELRHIVLADRNGDLVDSQSPEKESSLGIQSVDPGRVPLLCSLVAEVDLADGPVFRISDTHQARGWQGMVNRLAHPNRYPVVPSNGGTQLPAVVGRQEVGYEKHGRPPPLHACQILEGRPDIGATRLGTG